MEDVKLNPFLTKNTFFLVVILLGHAKCNDLNNEILYEYGCKTIPLFFDEGKASWSKIANAKLSVPCFMKLDESVIPHADLGIFTKKYKISKGTIFGPYAVPYYFIFYNIYVDKYICTKVFLREFFTEI